MWLEVIGRILSKVENNQTFVNRFRFFLQIQAAALKSFEKVLQVPESTAVGSIQSESSTVAGQMNKLDKF